MIPPSSPASRTVAQGVDRNVTVNGLALHLGGGSTIVPPATQEELRRALPQVEIVAMPGLGHYPSDEQPGDFLTLVERFLAAPRGRQLT